MKSKKSQIKMFETIAVLVVFFFLVAIGLVIYARAQAGSFQSGLDENLGYQVMNLMQQVNYLPELQCSSENIVSNNCFDRIKVKAFAQRAAGNQLYYNRIFGTSKISIIQVYPDSGTGANAVTLYNNIQTPSKCASMLKNQLPILLFDPVARRYNAAYIQLEVCK